MPALTYLSDQEVREWAAVPDDKDCNEILQELRSLTGENWVIGRHQVKFARRWFRRPLPITVYTLYADCHGEWQVMNLVTPEGGSNFYGSAQSREDVMNYMLGYIGGIQNARKTKKDQ